MKNLWNRILDHLFPYKLIVSVYGCVVCAEIDYENNCIRGHDFRATSPSRQYSLRFSTEAKLRKYAEDHLGLGESEWGLKQLKEKVFAGNLYPD